MNNLYTFLLKVEPFSKLPSPEVEQLSLVAQTVRHAKGEVLYSEGEEADYVWLLQEGRLEIFKYSAEGRQFAIEAIQPSQLFGTLCRLGIGAHSIYPCTA